MQKIINKTTEKEAIKIAKRYKVVTPDGITLSVYNKDLNIFEPYLIGMNEEFNSSDVSIPELTYFVAHSKIKGCQTVIAVDNTELENSKEQVAKNDIAKKGTEVPKVKKQ